MRVNAALDMTSSCGEFDQGMPFIVQAHVRYSPFARRKSSRARRKPNVRD
jgi:hypothetical protein